MIRNGNGMRWIRIHVIRFARYPYM